MPFDETYIIQARTGGGTLNVKELWLYRELLFFLVWRDIKVRYKQTFLGALWAVIQPSLMTAIFTLFFGKLAKIPSDGIPYPLFAYAGILPWMLFSEGFVRAAHSVVGDANLVRKIYFPRIFLPLSGVLTAFLDFCIAGIMFGILMLCFGVRPSPRIFFLPFFIALTLLTSLGAGFWFSALNARYRDVRYILGFLVQVWLFVSPVMYPLSLIPERWRLLYACNPMAGVIAGFRWALLGADPAFETIGVSVSIAACLLAGGIFYFRRMEEDFADVI